jgi:hypothetical protein
MIRRPASPSQGWLTFLGNHSTQIAAMDLLILGEALGILAETKLLKPIRNLPHRRPPMEACSGSNDDPSRQSEVLYEPRIQLVFGLDCSNARTDLCADGPV